MEGIHPLGALLVAGLLAAAPVAAQSTLGNETFEPEYLQPFAGPEQDGPPPRLEFVLAAEIALPGPLPGEGPRLVDGGVEIPVAGGMARGVWPPSGPVSIVPPAHSAAAGGDPTAFTEHWAVAPDGRFRACVMASGHVLVEKRCGHCVKGWRKKWRLRVAGRATAPPLITDSRVFFGALDNRVYGVKRKNGHRVWAVDVKGRASRRLRIWRTPSVGTEMPEAEANPLPPVELLLVVTDAGNSVVALDTRNGAQVAVYELPDDEGLLTGAPLVTPDGKILLAVQKYSQADAALVVLNLARPAKAAKPENRRKSPADGSNPDAELGAAGAVEPAVTASPGESVL
jgi:hypothetical protein